MDNQDKKLLEIFLRTYNRQKKTKSSDNPFLAKTKAISPIDVIAKKYSSRSYKKDPEKGKSQLALLYFFLLFFTSRWAEALFEEILKATEGGLILPYYDNRDLEVIDKILTRFLDEKRMHSIEQLFTMFGVKVKMKPWFKEVFTFISLKEIKKFRKEYQQKYRKKHKESTSVTVKKAEAGSTDALFQLIAWDKTWLYEQWVKDRILSAQSTDDKKFFKNLGKNISKLSGVHERTKHQSLFNQLKEFKDTGVNFDPKLIKELLDHFNDDENFPEQLCDDNYFPKFLKRHDLI